jgi:predicted TIM-barrel fold metal-dependent hydrolase
MQAGLSRRRLTLREIFSSRLLFVASKHVPFALFETAPAGYFSYSGSPSGGLATIDDGSTMEYPQAKFDLFHGGYPYCSELATLAKNLPNVYADLCWLHIISPAVTRRVLHEWIETIPAHKILGFGGDFFHVEGTYGHAQLARAITADVLADKVEEGYLKEDEAIGLMKRILYSNGKELFAERTV